LRSRVAAPKVWVPPANVPRPGDGLPRKGDDRSVGIPRDPARAPHATPLLPRFIDCVEQVVGVRPLVAAAEVRRRRPVADELDVQVRVRRVDVPERSAVPIGVVEPRVNFELDPTSAGHETLELASRLARIALPLPQLGRVDLHEADALAFANVEGVAVADALDGCALPRWLGTRLRAPADGEGESDEDERPQPG